ncbi:MAG: aldo/keto reductase [Deltaproteobacteria bacterium]|nr:aldo/keto reductase [Deltaproteobacteria bacterium]
MKSRTTLAAVICILAAALAGFFVAGRYLARASIGLDPSAFPFGELVQSIGLALFPHLEIAVGGLVLALGTVLVVPMVAFAIVRHVSRRPAQGTDTGRRGFLAGAGAGAGAAVGALVAGGTAMYGRAMLGWGNGGRGWKEPIEVVFGGEVVRTHPDYKEQWKGSRVQAYGRLGRTEWKVSDIVMGTGPLRSDNGAQLVRLALARGINYIDTAPDYSMSGSEQAVGKGIEGHPRDQFFLATKFCTPAGHLPPGTPVARYKEVIYESLARLGTSYVDLIHIHSCDEIDRLLDPNAHQAFEELRQEGKARFLGFSSHTPNLVQVANAAIDSGRFDVMMLAYHHGIWSALGNVIRRARQEQDMGVVAMKTLKGAKHQNLAGFRNEADSYAQAALKWARSNPDVSCAVISFFEMQHIDEYLHASGRSVSGADLAVLRKYDAEIRGSYCAPHCGECLEACPEGLPINDILRHRMYFEDYRAEKQGIEAYARLEKRAEACASCPAPCAGTCPLDIPIQERMQGAHELLSIG